MSSAAPAIFHARSSDAAPPITAVVVDRNDGRGANVLASEKGKTRSAARAMIPSRGRIRRVRKIEREHELGIVSKTIH